MGTADPVRLSVRRAEAYAAFSSATSLPDPAQEQLQKFLTSPLPGQAKPKEAASFYNPDNLYQYIDGGADVYLLYDFRRLIHQDFKSGSADITADIYDMGVPDNAFGIYAAERSPRYKFLPVGIEGYSSKGILNFVQDHYYVKLSAMSGSSETLLGSFARTLSQRIGGKKTVPALLTKLPTEKRIAHSEQYIRKDPLGHPFLAPAYVVGYSWSTKEGKLIVTVAAEPALAKARLEQLAKHFKDTGECKPAPELGDGAISAKNSFEGTMIARTQGRYLIALLNPPANGAQILKSTAQSLP
ncbi:MAG TPA: DUF6599 family protein [Candidatus Sulfotelmatobacter sp.]|nr:DUF6599 family protein [Candidatus Sulfotelmatobacter sp.]